MTEQAREKPPRRARGEGTVYWDKQRERFVATRIVGYDDRGKEIRKRGSGKSRSAAMEALRLRVRDYERGLAPGADKTTVSDIIKDWILYGQGQVDDKTVRTREFNCAHIDAGIGDVLLRKLTAKHVEKLLASMVATHSTRTIADVRACLNSAVKRAMARDLVDRNVVELVVTPRGEYRPEVQVPHGTSGARHPDVDQGSLDVRVHRGVDARRHPDRGDAGVDLGSGRPRRGPGHGRGLALGQEIRGHQDPEVQADTRDTRPRG